MAPKMMPNYFSYYCHECKTLFYSYFAETCLGCGSRAIEDVLESLSDEEFSDAEQSPLTDIYDTLEALNIISVDADVPVVRSDTIEDDTNDSTINYAEQIFREMFGLERMKQQTHTHGHAHRSKFLTRIRKDRECYICLEDIFRGSSIYKLHCGHVFHSYCARNWLAHRSVCPVCKVAVASEENR